MHNLLTKPEFYYWYLLPTILGVVTIIGTIKETNKNRDYKNLCICIVALFLIGFSQVIVIQIFLFEAWPTFVPYLMIVVGLILLLLQYSSNRKRKIVL
jgi:surface polysaccharide O-acyltransferase-like enzyme